MSNCYQTNDQFGTYFLIFTIVDWVDLFTRKIYEDLMMETLNFSYELAGKGRKLEICP